MNLLERIGAPNDLSDVDSFPWLWAYLKTCDPGRQDYIDAQIMELSLALAERGQFGIADAGVIEISHRLGLTLDRYLQIAVKLCQIHPEFLSTRLFHHYLNRGGVKRDAFEYEISRIFQLGQYEEITSLFESSQKWFDWKTYRRDVLFLIANAYALTKNQDENFRLLKYLVERYPEDRTYRNNMSYLALIVRHDAAGRYVRQISRSIAESYVDDLDPHAVDEGVVVDLRRQGEAAVVGALKRYGLCHVKNGADPAIASDILAHVQEFGDVGFPTHFTAYTRRRCEELLRFDVAQVVNAVLPEQGQIDDSACIIRRVDPVNAASFTPFHQDATAFQKAVVNIWTPLTPAGGDYPTMEFVKRRVNSAEETMAGADEYNLVRIDDKSVLEKFKGEFYEPHDVMPGDCIIFLGTTIHRSTSLKDATKPRYSLEIRWS